jgi:hypothetical protein
MTRTFEPTPSIRTPAACKNLHKPCTWGSDAALIIVVTPRAPAAAIIAFSVAVTDASSKQISAQRNPLVASRMKSTGAAGWSGCSRRTVSLAPSDLKTIKWVSSLLLPIGSPPGCGITAFPVRARSADAKRMEPRIVLDISSGSSLAGTLELCIVTLPPRNSETCAPRCTAIDNILRTSPISGTLDRTTASPHSIAAAMTGNASFLFPEILTVPFSLNPPSTIKLLTRASSEWVSKEPRLQLVVLQQAFPEFLLELYKMNNIPNPLKMQNNYCLMCVCSLEMYDFGRAQKFSFTRAGFITVSE